MNNQINKTKTFEDVVNILLNRNNFFYLRVEKEKYSSGRPIANIIVPKCINLKDLKKLDEIFNVIGVEAREEGLLLNVAVYGLKKEVDLEDE